MMRVLLVVLCLFVSCGRGPSVQEQVLRVNIVSDPQSLDPRKARDSTSTTLTRMLFEGLTRISKSGEVEMALARDVEISEDGTRYLFHLRKSYWSNGDPVTAFDFATSWKTILDPHFPTDIAYQLYGIKNGRKAKLGEVAFDSIGLKTPDAFTLIVELEQPTPYFLELVASSPFFPIHTKNAQANPNWALQPESWVSNGPFVVKAWNHSDQLRVVKNERYWQAKEISLQRIDLSMISPDTEIRMFEEGKLDWAGSPLSTIPADAVPHFKGGKQLHINPFLATYFFRTNTAAKIKEKKNPLCNSSFRRALFLALDSKSITEHILQGGQTPAQSLVPPEMGLSQKMYIPENSREQALSLLSAALLELDLTRETLEPLTLSYYNNERNSAIAQAVQKQWKEGLGIAVALEAIEPKVFFQRISQKEFQLAAGSWTADFNDPVNFLEVFKYKEGSTNNTQWENLKYIDLLNQSAVCRNSEERKGLLREAEQILMEQMPVIPVFHYALNYLQSEKLKEVALSPLGQIDFRWAHLDSSN